MTAAVVASAPKRAKPAPGGLRSAGSALDALECFATDSELGVTDVARRLNVAKSTAHRLVQTLCSRGFAEQDPNTGRYRLGMHVYELGYLAQARSDYRRAALPHMHDIAVATELNVNFAVPDGSDVVFVESIETGSASHIVERTGRRLPMHGTSSGKAIAAFNPSAAQDRIDAGFPVLASRTVRNSEDWERALEQVRRHGFAIAHHEAFEELTSIAVPVLRHRRAVAAISVFASTADIVPDLDRIRGLLTTASQRIAADLARGPGVEDALR